MTLANYIGSDYFTYHPHAQTLGPSVPNWPPAIQPGVDSARVLLWSGGHRTSSMHPNGPPPLPTQLVDPPPLAKSPAGDRRGDKAPAKQEPGSGGFLFSWS